jgi:hypothetical protein
MPTLLQQGNRCAGTGHPIPIRKQQRHERQLLTSWLFGRRGTITGCWCARREIFSVGFSTPYQSCQDLKVPIEPNGVLQTRA